MNDRRSIDKRPRTLPAHALRAVAVAAQADPATVRRVLRGERVRGMVAERIRVALAERETKA